LPPDAVPRISEDRIPVIVGVGEVNDRPAVATKGLSSLDLMRVALELADEDAGGGLLAVIESLDVVNQISWPVDDLVGDLVRRLGIAPTHATTDAPSGDSPVRYITGGEALRTAAARTKAGTTSSGPSKEMMRVRAEAMASPLRLKYGLLTPTDIYPLYENATRARWNQSLAEAQAESAGIWAGFSEVATTNPFAWIRQRHTPDMIVTGSADNRPIAHPYTKLMVANAAVNQGAAVILTSLAKAKAMGVPEHRLIYVWAGAAAKEPDNFLLRDRFDHSPSMTAVLEKVLEFNALDIDAFDDVELYSCFPCVPKMARRVLGWPDTKPASVVGGLTFAGGPIGNYMAHAAAGMVRKLRRTGTYGLLYGNGGVVTKNHAIVLARQPPPAGLHPQDYDVQARADAMRGPIPTLIEEHAGPAAVETFTVIYERDGSPKFGIVIGRTPAGERFVARVPKEDTATIDFLTSGASEPVGASGRAMIGDKGLVEWRL
jgi:acetyl-CoA C-acetyltransferase